MCTAGPVPFARPQPVRMPCSAWVTCSCSWTRRFIALRTAKRFGEARELSRGLWQRLGGDAAAHVRAAAARQYADMFAALPEPAYLTYGNVDLPQMWAEHLRPGHHVLDGEQVE